MEIDVHIYIHQISDAKLDVITKQLNTVLSKLETVIAKEVHMSAELDALTIQVQANTDAEASAILLIQGLASQIADLKDDPVAIAELSARLKTSADALAAAIVANTQ